MVDIRSRDELVMSEEGGRNRAVRQDVEGQLDQAVPVSLREEGDRSHEWGSRLSQLRPGVGLRVVPDHCTGARRPAS